MSRMDVFNQDNINLLVDLFGKSLISEKLERLRYIHANTEHNWLLNLRRYEGHEIKYLLFCEAPPFSEESVPTYFYNQTKGNLNSKIWKTFFGRTKKPVLDEEYYQKLAEKGFLLIDTLPFSMQYSSKQRRHVAYNKLLENYLDQIINKLNHKEIKISSEVQIAFGFKLNALCFINVTGGKLLLKKYRTLQFDASKIAADNSGFTNIAKLSKIFSLEDDALSTYRYYNGERDNPFKKGPYELDLLNPKSLFWYYEKEYHLSQHNRDSTVKTDYKHFIENLIHNRLSEYRRSDYDLWAMYFQNTVK